MNKKSICKALPLLVILGTLTSCACSDFQQKFPERRAFNANITKIRKVDTLAATTPEHAVVDKADAEEKESLKESLATAAGIAAGLGVVGFSFWVGFNSSEMG
ncbi:MAG: hypothetical protein J6Y03_02640 [Alphaproteobacteria bacterium]|nr:hypothetical protein [Alphaproteobacteria bacterium]